MNKKKSLSIVIISIIFLLSLVTLPAQPTHAAGYKVGLVVDSTGVDDNGWNELAYEGVLRAQSTWGIVPTVYASDDFLASLTACASVNSLCIAANWMAVDAIQTVAAAVPTVKFAILDSRIEPPPPNLRNIVFDEKQVGYLAGVLAAKMSSSNVIGAVGGMDITPVVNFLEGYKNGAQCTKPAITVLEKYTGTFVDPALGATVATDMIAKSADVIFGAAGPTGNGAILYSAQHDKFSIGVDTDQYLSVFGNGTVDGADKLLTSAMKKLDNAVWMTIDQATAGTFTGGEFLMNLQNDGVGLAPFHQTDLLIPNSVKAYLYDVAASIIAGTTYIDDPCAISIWHGYPDGSSDANALDLVIANTMANNPTWPPIKDSYHPNLTNEFSQAVTNGWGPDFVIADSGKLGYMARDGLVMDLDTLLAGKLTNRYPAAVNAMKVDGVLYGVPESSKTVALYYNKVKVATPPTTTAELLSLVQGGKKLAGIGVDAGSYYFYGFYNAFGGQLLNSGALCIADQAGVANAMIYLKSLQANGANLQLTYNQANDGFINGTYDMIFNGPWAFSSYQAALGSNLGVVVLPAGPSGAAKPFLGVDGFFMNGKLPSPPEVIANLVDVALYMTNQANSQTFTNVGLHIPVRTDVASTNPLINTFAQAGSQGDPFPWAPEMENYWNNFNTDILAILQGSLSPQMGIQHACQQMNEANNFPAVSGSLGANGSSGRVAYATGWTSAQVDGTYKFYVESGWTGVITPTRPGFAFTPTTRTISIPVTIDVTGQDFTAATSASFVDVPASHWAFTWIERLLNSGVTTGCNPALQQYCPETPVTRDQMAVFLERAMRGSTYSPPEAIGIFADVPISHWAARFIEKLYADGITTGCLFSPLRYCPTQEVTRAQMAAFLLRARYGAAYTPPAATGIFNDVPTSHWAAKYIEKLYQDGITGGCNPTLMLYCPEDPVTRAQMAVFLVRTFYLP